METDENGSVPFPDEIFTRKSDESLRNSVYRKKFRTAI